MVLLFQCACKECSLVQHLPYFNTCKELIGAICYQETENIWIAFPQENPPTPIKGQIHQWYSPALTYLASYSSKYQILTYLSKRIIDSIETIKANVRMHPLVLKLHSSHISPDPLLKIMFHLLLRPTRKHYCQKLHIH